MFVELMSKSACVLADTVCVHRHEFHPAFSRKYFVFN
jgi:hypothetical protein